MPGFPDEYIEHAREMNRIAGETLRLETKDATYIARKISIGLSLQAMELVGKSILISLGSDLRTIRKKHKNHDVLAILVDAENCIANSALKTMVKYRRFLYWAPIIDNQEFRTTIKIYLEKHFSRGRTARPRNYFYPDEPTFSGPNPIQSIFVMTEHLIEIAIAINSDIGKASCGS